jgi:hypothetical protein
MKKRSETMLLRESVEDLRRTLLNTAVDAEIALMTREEICALQGCAKDYFYDHIEPHLHRDQDRARYTRASYEAFVRRRIVNAAGAKVYDVKPPKRRADRLASSPTPKGD